MLATGFISVYLILQYGDLDELTFQLLEDNRYAYRELYQKEKNENEKHKGELEILRSEINTMKEKNESLAESLEKMIKEKEIVDGKLEQAMEEVSSLKKQLEEMKIAKEGELDDIRIKLYKEKNSSIAKEKEHQNLIKENEKLQSKYDAAKKHNHILLDVNSRIHSAMEELEATQEEVSQLKEYIQKTKNNFEQISLEFIQKFQLLRQKVNENIMLKIKANQDCSALMLECNELTRKLNAVLCENRCLRGN